MAISIHRLREEPDGVEQGANARQIAFQSTGSVRSPTVSHSIGTDRTDISIHRLREEPDPWQTVFTFLMGNFNPQAP